MSSKRQQSSSSVGSARIRASGGVPRSLSAADEPPGRSSSGWPKPTWTGTASTSTKSMNESFGSPCTGLVARRPRQRSRRCRQTFRRGVDQRHRGRGVRHRYRQHIRILGQGRGPLLIRRSNRPEPHDRRRRRKLSQHARRVPNHRRALPPRLAQPQRPGTGCPHRALGD